MKVELKSDAWPEGHVISELCRIHGIIASLNVPIRREDLVYHRMGLDDIKDFKDYEGEWFPFQYSDWFYKTHITAKDSVSLGCYWRPPNSPAEEYLVGGVMARYEWDEAALGYVSSSSGVDPKTGCCGWLCNVIWNFRKENMYIMTIGVADEVRRLGAGSGLMRELERTIRTERPTCVCISLHVLETNRAAMGCYRKNGFQATRMIRKYYEMFGKNYDAQYYVKAICGKEQGTEMDRRPLLADGQTKK